MVYNPDIHNFRSIRLKGCDSSQAGAYLVTIVAQVNIDTEIVYGTQDCLSAEWHRITESS